MDKESFPKLVRTVLILCVGKQDRGRAIEGTSCIARVTSSHMTVVSIDLCKGFF